MIIVDQQKCTGCGLCQKICHEGCISIINGSSSKAVEVNHALCSTCTQCIAICPRQALSWDRVLPASCEKDQLPGARQVEELFKQRRTIRDFKPDRIERALLEEIVRIGSYAPTNNYHLRAIVVDDPNVLQRFDTVILRSVRLYYQAFFKSRWVFAVLRHLTPKVSLKQKVKLEHGLARGRAFETPPAAMVLVIGDRRILLSEISAHYALYTMILYAQARGIASRIQSAGPITLDKNNAARRTLGLAKHERILAALDLGYPAVRFRNKVEGKTLPIQWNGRSAYA